MFASMHPYPRLAAFIETETSAVLALAVPDAARPTFIALHNRIDDPWVLRIHREPDAAGHLRQTVLELLPGRAAIDTLENPPQVLAVRRIRPVEERPGLALPRVERRG